MKNSNKIDEILRRLEQLQKSVIDIKMSIEGKSNVVSTSSVPRNALTEMSELARASGVHGSSPRLLTETQLAILNAVESSGKEVTAQDIQKRLGYRSRATVSHNLNDLVRLGVLQKRRGKKSLYFVT